MSPEEKRLHKLFSRLSDVNQGAVMAFAEFLHQRQHSSGGTRVSALPLVIARPPEESVPAALKRLRLTYPMLDAADLLAEASDLLSQYLILGRSASDVIDDMESLFQRHHHRYCANSMDL